MAPAEQADEFRKFLRSLSTEFDESNLDALVSQLDSDKDGKITFPEFASLFGGLRLNPRRASEAGVRA